MGIKRGCELCRGAHAKCDRKHPRCSRCAWLDKECIREPEYRFQNSTDGQVDQQYRPAQDGSLFFQYPKDQIWVETPREVEFVLEGSDLSIDGPQHQLSSRGSTAMEETLSPDVTPDPSSSLMHVSTSSSHQISTLPPIRCLENVTVPLFGPDKSAEMLDGSGSTLLSTDGRDQPQILSSHVRGSSNNTATTSGSDVFNTITATESGYLSSSRIRHVSVTSVSGSPHSISSPLSDRHEFRGRARIPVSLSPLYGHGSNTETGFRESPWQLSTADEAMLVRYFVTDLSPLFDYCDPERSFSTTVVQRAVGCPTLLLAILAASSRHLSLTSGYDSYLADQYHRECLALLIPMLSDTSTLLDEAICAATVILRFFEEISVPLVGKDTRSHLLGTHVFVRAQEYRASGIHQASFRVALRQEITVAFSNRQPVQLLPEYINVDRSNSLNSDWGWTFRIIVLCAEVLNHCYGNGPKESAQQPWFELASRAEDWLREKPASFEPLRCVGGHRVFPEIWLLNDCHIAGHIYYLMCHILLTAYDPARPRLGPDRDEATHHADEIIKEDVRKICGIALSNPHVLPSMFKASAVIAMCGDLFTECMEQQALQDLLVKTQVDLAWPTAGAQNYLKGRWGISS